MNVTHENVKLKKEVNQWVARYFYGAERTPEKLALMYYLLDDLLKFIEEAQVKVGQEMLDSDYDEVYITDKSVKVYHDDELHCILIDSLSKEEAFKCLMNSNKKYTEELNANQKSKT